MAAAPLVPSWIRTGISAYPSLSDLAAALAMAFARMQADDWNEEDDGCIDPGGVGVGAPCEAHAAPLPFASPSQF